MTSLKLIGISTTLLATPYVMLGTLRQCSVSRNLRNFTQTNCKLPGAPTDLLWVKWPPFPINPNRDSHLKSSDWKSWTYTDGSCHIQEGKTSVGAGVYHPGSGNSSLVEPNGAGITNTIGRAELAAIAAAITHDHTHTATDSLISLHQIRKQLLCPEKNRHHVQGDLLKILSITIRNSSHIFLYKAKFHAVIAGNECADALA